MLLLTSGQGVDACSRYGCINSTAAPRYCGMCDCPGQDFPPIIFNSCKQALNSSKSSGNMGTPISFEVNLWMLVIYLGNLMLPLSYQSLKYENSNTMS